MTIYLIQTTDGIIKAYDYILGVTALIVYPLCDDELTKQPISVNVPYSKVSFPIASTIK